MQSTPSNFARSALDAAPDAMIIIDASEDSVAIFYPTAVNDAGSPEVSGGRPVDRSYVMRQAKSTP